MVHGLFRILVVDDERVLTWALKEHLSEDGHDVTVTNTYECGLESFSQGEWDLVITDINLAGADEGIELLKHVKTSSPSTAVVITTARAEFRFVQMAMRHQAYDYIQKPYHIDQIRDVISRLCKDSQIYRENRQLRQENLALVSKAREWDVLMRRYRVPPKDTSSQCQVRTTSFPAQDDPSCWIDSGQVFPEYAYIFIAKIAKTQHQELQTRVEQAFLKSFVISLLTRGDRPSTILYHLNHVFQRNQWGPAALFLGFYYPSSGRLLYSNAALYPVYVNHAGENFPLVHTDAWLGLSRTTRYSERWLDAPSPHRLLYLDAPSHSGDKGLQGMTPSGAVLDAMAAPFDRFEKECETWHPQWLCCVADFHPQTSPAKVVCWENPEQEIHDVKDWLLGRLRNESGTANAALDHAFVTSWIEIYLYLDHCRQGRPLEGCLSLTVSPTCLSCCLQLKDGLLEKRAFYDSKTHALVQKLGMECHWIQKEDMAELSWVRPMPALHTAT